MKNKNLMMGLGFAAFSMSMQAQTTIATLGFETGDQKYTTSGSLSKKGTFGDWVNPQENDTWTEQNQDGVHSGDYCLLAENAEGYDGQTWDRGFKIGNLQLKENTAYRVSFWLKVSRNTFSAAEDGSTKNVGLRAWLSKGIENYDKSLCTPSGTNYGIEKDGNFEVGEWQRFSFVSYYTTADLMNSYVTANQTWVGGGVCPENLGGDGTKTYKEVFENKIPEQFFAIINMHSPATYALDDIKIEEGVTFNAATYFGDVIRLDFGYNTNIAELANANGGTVSLDPSCVKITIDGTEVPVQYLEGKRDGYLYAFLEEGTKINGTDILVSFTPAEDCPIKYSGEKRPSSDVESEMTILGFENEVIYPSSFDFDVVSSAYAAPTVLSCVPENNSFNLSSDSFKEIVVNYNKKIDIKRADISYTYKDNFGKHEVIIEDYSLGADGQSLIINVPTLANNEYVFEIYDIASEGGETSEDPTVLTYEIGKSTAIETVDTIYASNFDNETTGTVPAGWYTYNSAGVHQYGFNDEARTSQYNYNWGGTPGGGGTRLYDGFSGDFKKALYWGTRDTNEGYCTYGQLVEDYLDEKTGLVRDDAPEDIKETALYLTPRKYQIYFLMAAWKNSPTFTFTLEDLNGNVYAKFTDFVAAPTAADSNGNKYNGGKITGSVKCVSDFTVEKEGYYVLKFTGAEAQWQEFLLANVNLITMPSKAAYYNGLINKKIDEAQKVLDESADAKFDGETKTALQNKITLITNTEFTAPSAVDAQLDELDAAKNALVDRKDNLVSFDEAKEKIANAVLDLDFVDDKYKNSSYAKEAVKVSEKYANVEGHTLNDADLKEATQKLVSTAEFVNSISSIVDVLTWRASQALSIANLFEVSGDNFEAVKALGDDDAAVINKLNGDIAYALVNKLAKGEDINILKDPVYNTSITVDEPDSENYNDDYNPLEFNGINLSSFVNNSHFYRVNGNDGVPGWTIEPGAEGKTIALNYNQTPSNASPVLDCQISSYGDNNYKFYQVIEGLPAGIYNVCIQTRTPYVSKVLEGEETETVYYYNAQDEEGTWDKYIYAKGDEGSEGVAPYAGASGLVTTFVKDIKVTNGKLEIGAIENYVSGKAVSHETNEATDSWLGTSYVDYANIYYVAPVEGYNYSEAATGIENAETAVSISEIFTVGGVRQNKLNKGINIVKYTDGSVRKFINK